MLSRNSKNQINNLAIILTDNGRARAYLSELAKAKLLPSAAIVVESPEIIDKPQERFFSNYFDNTTPIKEKLRSLEISYEAFSVESINELSVVEYTLSLKQELIVFAGSAGSILSSKYFRNDKKLIHVHPGKLPEYRGSTPMYYSLLNENNITMSAFLMSEQLDGGNVIFEESFTDITDKRKIDTELDPYFRAVVLAKALERYLDNGCLASQNNSDVDEEKFYIIHPILKHLAILASNDNSGNQKQ